jgi:hypothetical protein
MVVVTPDKSYQTREAGLRRLVLARRWIVTGSVTLAGVLAAVAANAFPGKTIKPSGARTTGEGGPEERSTGAGEQSGESSEGSSGSVTPPEQAPQPAEGQESAPVEETSQAAPEAPVISGGS